MTEKFSGFLRTRELSHTEYPNFILFSINCQRSTTLIWQLFLYRAAGKNHRTRVVKPGKGFFWECWWRFYLPYKAARPSLLAWGLEWFSQWTFPGGSRLYCLCAWGLAQHYFEVKVDANRMGRNFWGLESMLRHLNWNKEIEWNTFKIGLK